MMMTKRIFLVLNLLLAAIFIFTGLGIIHSLRKVDIEAPPEAIDDYRLVTPQPVARPLSYYSEIIGRRALFGSPPYELEEVKPVALPPTDLKLRLVGTIYSTPLLSRAIIEDLSSRRQSLYRLGDMVAGAKIIRIDRSQVVIERGGIQEILLMAAHEGSMLAQQERPVEPLPMHIQPIEPFVELPIESLPAYVQPLPESVVLGEREIAAATEAASRIIEKLRIDPRNLREIPANIMEAIDTANEVLTRARIRPHFSGGRLRGITVADIHPGSIYEQMGLRSGDIIKTINGHRVNSIQGILQIYNEARQQPTVTIGIDRGGRAVTLVHRIGAGGN